MKANTANDYNNDNNNNNNNNNNNTANDRLLSVGMRCVRICRDLSLIR